MRSSAASIPDVSDGKLVGCFHVDFGAKILTISSFSSLKRAVICNNCVRRRRTLSIHVVSSRGIDHFPRLSIAMPVDFRVWTPSWTGTLSLDAIWTGTRSLDSMCHIALIPFD